MTALRRVLRDSRVAAAAGLSVGALGALAVFRFAELLFAMGVRL